MTSAQKNAYFFFSFIDFKFDDNVVLARFEIVFETNYKAGLVLNKNLIPQVDDSTSSNPVVCVVNW